MNVITRSVSRGRYAVHDADFDRVQPDVTSCMVDLHDMVGLMQEAALVLTRGGGRPGVAMDDYLTEYLNDHAARDLGADVTELLGCGLMQMLPADTADMLHWLCKEALQAPEPVEYFAAAPDPMTDLSGTASISVRATRMNDAVLCTWVPGWHVVGENKYRRPLTAAGGSVADRLELATTLDTLADTGFGVFSVNLMTGRIIWSQGIYTIFGRTLDEGPLDITECASLVEPVATRPDAWKTLVSQGKPLDVTVRLLPQLGGHRLRFVAYASLGPDGHPAVLHGYCCVGHD